MDINQIKDVLAYFAFPAAFGGLAWRISRYITQLEADARAFGDSLMNNHLHHMAADLAEMKTDLKEALK